MDSTAKLWDVGGCDRGEYGKASEICTLMG